MVLRVKPTPTRFPTNSLYTLVENTPMHSISSVCHPWRTHVKDERAPLMKRPWTLIGLRDSLKRGHVSPAFNPFWTRFGEGSQLVGRGKQCHPLCCMSPTLVTCYHGLAAIPLSEINREISLVLAWGGTHELSTPLPKAKKPV